MSVFNPDNIAPWMNYYHLNRLDLLAESDLNDATNIWISFRINNPSLNDDWIEDAQEYNPRFFKIENLKSVCQTRDARIEFAAAPLM